MMIHKTLREYLERAGTTEKEIAAQLGISTSHLSMIKKGTRRPSPEVALRIETLTGIPFRSLLLAKNKSAA
jgi:HTH-type transcriptional regulator / antitoxin HigA